MATLDELQGRVFALEAEIRRLHGNLSVVASRRDGSGLAPADAAYIVSGTPSPSTPNALALEVVVDSGLSVTPGSGTISIDLDPGNIGTGSRGPLISSLGGTDQSVVNRGDLLAGHFEGDWTRLPAGAIGSILSPDPTLDEGVQWLENFLVYPRVLSADEVNDDVTPDTFKDVPELEVACLTGQVTYFRYVLFYTAAATTTGAVFSVNGPAFTALHYQSEYSLTATSRTINEGLNTYDTPATSNASSASTGSNIAIIQGMIVSTTDDPLFARFASEVSGSAITVKAGSFCQYYSFPV